MDSGKFLHHLTLSWRRNEEEEEVYMRRRSIYSLPYEKKKKSINKLDTIFKERGAVITTAACCILCVFLVLWCEVLKNAVDPTK